MICNAWSCLRIARMRSYSSCVASFTPIGPLWKTLFMAVSQSLIKVIFPFCVGYSSSSHAAKMMTE